MVASLAPADVWAPSSRGMTRVGRFAREPRGLTAARPDTEALAWSPGKEASPCRIRPGPPGRLSGVCRGLQKGIFHTTIALYLWTPSTSATSKITVTSCRPTGTEAPT